MHTEKIKTLVNKYYDKAVKIRHHLHKYPEISFREENTAKLVEKTLAEFGIKTQRLFNTGVTGLIEGAKPGKTVLLRADMDALEMMEEADVEYKSVIPGAMHACGHDGHTAGLLLCAMVMSEMKDELHGNIKLMFQPGEEKGTGGALPMINEGILDNPKVDAAFACHLWGPAPEGKVWIRSGPVMAAPDRFRVKVIGKGGHAAMPHLSTDPVVNAAQIINSFQTIISRRINPLEPAVISVCLINGGTAHNIIPEYVEFSGTIRTFDSKLREWIPKVMEETVAGITRSQGADYEFEHEKRYPPLINDEKMTNLAKNSIKKITGDENLEYMKEPNMGAEDFSNLSQYIPSSYFFVGLSKDVNNPVIHHNPHFSWDDKVLKISAASLCQIALDFLSGNF